MNKEKLLELFGKFGGKTPVLLGVAAFAIAGVIVFFLWSGGPDYQPLYTKLSPEDSGAVIQKLKEKKVAYKVDGTAISVPAEKVYELRMELAGEGLPQGGGIGFEIFDKSGFGVTDFVQKVNYRRALQGELARVITQIKEVETAKVTLAIPEKSIFLENEKRPKASVLLKLKTGKGLTAEQVGSIVHLVSNSVENMNREDVTIIDTFGKMWTTPAGDNNTMLSASQLEYKRSIEKDYESRIQSMLEKAVGPNKVVARVSVEVDNRQVERTEESYNPDGQVVRSEQRSKENSTSGSTSNTLPGLAANMPDSGKQNTGGQQSPSSNRQDEVINYEISKVVSRTIEPVGSIKKFSASILIDGTYETVKGADGKEARKFVARTEEDIAKFTEMVKGAIGFTKERGDAITVVSAPFDTEYSDAMAEAPKASIIPETVAPLLPLLIKYGSATIVALLVVFFVLKPIAGKLGSPEGRQGRTLATAHETLPQGLPEGAGNIALPPITLQEDDTIKRLKQLAKDNPQQVAMVLKSWLKER